MPLNSRYKDESRKAFRKRKRLQRKFGKPGRFRPKTMPPSGTIPSRGRGKAGAPGQVKKNAGIVKDPKQATHAVPGNVKFRSRIGLGDLNRAVKRRDKTTVTRSEARKSFLASAKTALASNVDTPKLGAKLKKRGYLKPDKEIRSQPATRPGVPPSYGKQPKKKKKKAGTTTSTPA